MVNFWSRNSAFRMVRFEFSKFVRFLFPLNSHFTVLIESNHFDDQKRSSSKKKSFLKYAALYNQQQQKFHFMNVYGISFFSFRFFATTTTKNWCQTGKNLFSANTHYVMNKFIQNHFTDHNHHHHHTIYSHTQCSKRTKKVFYAFVNK